VLTRSPHALRLQEVDAIDTGGPDEIEKHQYSLYPRNSTGEGDEEINNRDQQSKSRSATVARCVERKSIRSELPEIGQWPS
jgi:hypothetical protein